MRILKNSSGHNSYKIIQIQAKDFRNFYNATTNRFHYNNVPFSKVTSLEISRNLYEVKYKTSFLQDFSVANIRHHKLRKMPNQDKLEVKECSKNSFIPQQKVQA